MKDKNSTNKTKGCPCEYPNYCKYYPGCYHHNDMTWVTEFLQHLINNREQVINDLGQIMDNSILKGE